MQPVVSVVGPPGTRGASHHLAGGQRVLFGACQCGGCGFDLVVPAGRTGAPAGRVTAHQDHWRIDNLGAPPLAVIDLEQPLSQITVASGRIGVAVPFELSGIRDGERLLVTVLGPEQVFLPRIAESCPAVNQLPPSSWLNQDTLHFAVLVALCEPRLRPPASALTSGRPPALPTSRDIALTLARRGVAISPRAVDAHIEYLVEKLHLHSGHREGRAGRTWRKEVLVTAALEQQLVQPAHLAATLPRPRRPHLNPQRLGPRSPG